MLEGDLPSNALMLVQNWKNMHLAKLLAMRASQKIQSAATEIMLFHKIAKISPLPGLRLMVCFMSGEMKQIISSQF